ncbi:MAG: SpoIIE family protein phosphatase [Deltaproteobacteria bacterium]|nr:SpoIIE family protein phosphatase [Deltaproteobacteria bacterium]
MAKLDYFLFVRPLENGRSGDTGVVREFNDKVFLGLVDVLGHGEEAWKAAKIYKRFLEKNYRRSLVEIGEKLHEHIHKKGIRGAVIGVCHLVKNTGELSYIVTGDISLRKFGTISERAVSQPGIMGEAIRFLREKKTHLVDDDVLILHSDGIKYHFDLRDYPQLFKESARNIATNLIAKFGKDHDDASCIVLKYARIIGK